jgi:hypothetical protein
VERGLKKINSTRIKPQTQSTSRGKGEKMQTSFEVA